MFDRLVDRRLSTSPDLGIFAFYFDRRRQSSGRFFDIFDYDRFNHPRAKVRLEYSLSILYC